jgi:hypothetical protein
MKDAVSDHTCIGKYIIMLDSVLQVIYNQVKEQNLMSTESEESTQKNDHFEEAREHMHAARKAMHKTFEAWLPQGYLEHRKAARKEFLMAMRSLVDAAIERVEKTTK